MTNWVEIDESRLRANYEVIAGIVGAGAGPEATVLAVVKANAYGHGLAKCARVLAAAGVEWLGVTRVEEGGVVRRSLRNAGIGVEAQPRVQVMSGISEEDVEAVIADGLTPVIWSVEQVGWLRAAAKRAESQRQGTVVRVFLEIDSGMTRQGVRPGGELREVVKAIQAAKGVRVEGVMTHFPSAEMVGLSEVGEQRGKFEQALREIAEEGVVPEWVSVGNTSGVDLVEGPENFFHWIARLRVETSARVMVRTGLGLYGYCSPLTLAPWDGTYSWPGISQLEGKLQPVMTWKAKVIGVEDVPAGVEVGYNGTYVTERPMRLALVSAGYADGFRRELSGTNEMPGGWVMLRGKRAAVVGRVSMNLTSVDVTRIEGVKVGDDAVLLGEGFSAEDHAREARTIAYEILCGVRAGER